MGIKHNKKQKKVNEEQNEQNFGEKILFQSFQNKAMKIEITSIAYFKFNSEDVVISQQPNKEAPNEDNSISSMNDISDYMVLDKKSKKIKKVVYLDLSQIKNKLFIFLATIDNSIYVIDSHTFEKLLRFREESKTNKIKCKKMFQIQNKKSTLICIHENKININRIKIINSHNKSSIFCEQIQSIFFEYSYISVFDIIEINTGQLIIGLEGYLFIWDKTDKIENINMSKAEEKKLYEKILNTVYLSDASHISGDNEQEENNGYCIKNKGNHHYIPQKVFSIKYSNKIPIIQKASVNNILQVNNSIFVILLNINDNSSIVRFYDIIEKEIFFEEKNDIIIHQNKFKKNNINYIKLFYITDKFFGIINSENITIISSSFKQIVSIYQINDFSLASNPKKMDNVFIPNNFLLFDDHYFIVQFIDIITESIYLKMFRLVINNKSNFTEIMNATNHLKVNNIVKFFLQFKNVKDIKENNVNFSAKFFLTANNSEIKKWIITGYEKE